ncbi:MAG: sulfotransferase [Panacagrimonas sp.]|jgi:hypothetical protein|nr:sulfotransferase [Panacagrimonas sp.]MCC2657844.1 sulfotransferase [Panacagrimonas sp.]
MTRRHFLPDALIAEASQAAGGVTDFGDPSFRPALEVLCRALDEEARLSDTGRHVFKLKLVGQLATRLRLEDDLHRHPEILGEVVAPPLVIVGLPRTGTTKLHRLLSRDPRFWWMAFWESQFPLPLTGEAPGDPKARIAEGHKLVDMMTTAMPKLMAIHPMAAEEADEEVMLMEHSMLSAFDAYASIPSYSQWLNQQDQSPAYRFLARMLQHLQWQKRRRGIRAQRWVLKAPHHLQRMDILLKVFPGAQVIQTHRDPLRSIPSIASFIDTLWRIYSDQADPVEAGRTWSERMRLGLDHTMRVRQGSPAAFMDVQFQDTVKRPMDVVRRIYDFIGWDLSPDVQAGMRAWLIEDEKSHSAAHDYSAETFGLSDAQIERDFAAYRERHILSATA